MEQCSSKQSELWTDTHNYSNGYHAESGCNMIVKLIIPLYQTNAIRAQHNLLSMLTPPTPRKRLLA